MSRFSVKAASLSRLTFPALVCFGLAGCGESQQNTNLYRVQQQRFEIKIPARGELFAAKATVISAPMGGNGPQNLAWLAPEYSQVKAGDIIARFDGEAMERESREKNNDMSITEQDIIEKSAALTQELSAINQDIGVVFQEKGFAEQFSIDDIRIRSKLEILDSLQNTAFLGAKQEYLNWKKGSFEQSSQGDIGLLEMKRSQQSSKITQLNESLSRLEITAPHDGLLTYKTNWRGEKPRAGKSLWPGQKIAELPDISEMKAKLFVFEHEAIGLAAGQEVSLVLNAFADQPFNGVVESVAPFPASIKRGDPQKYFEVVVSLNKQQTDLFVPGRKLSASITVTPGSDKVIVPLQSVFIEDNKPYVYLYAGGGYRRQNVTLGQSSLSHVEVLSGLEVSQQIALIKIEDV
ncbi:HlyD family efflux transporter periplasmic adaptor subunit [Thalassomonas viridans]|uniref:HlyD family efflux transporter periplasmic adaptor subunit n=1 Tax=Thalassomonas viridans TaxID=137584 RepID=A0AAE9Z7Y6_9GAMM|nr:efflux RND transporter periplasmic adaptor subunit [Thalassomonas viridans]WDE06953.1 HlyD family efflux transporter periplasmic adaptor subunit [Thalassomonas viridans]